MTDSEIGDDWQVIRSDESRSAAVEFGLHQFQSFVEVDVIQMQERQNAGISALSPEVKANVCALEVFFQQARSHTARPFVEISKQDSRAYVVAVFQHVFVQQLFSLMPPFDERRSQVDVVNVQRLFAVQVNVYAQASALFSTCDADVVVARGDYWEAAQDYVAVSAALQLPVFSQPEIQAKLAGDEMRLVVLVFLALNAMNFLHGYDVGVNFAQYFNDPLRAQTAIYPHAFVNVVSGDSKSFYFTHCRLTRYSAEPPRRR